MNNIYIIVFFSAIVILFLVRIIVCYNYAKIKGKYGERQVAKTLMRLPNGYTIFNDVYIWEKDFGKTTHIGIVTFVGDAGQVVGGLESEGEAGRAEFKKFTVDEALTLDNLSEPYKRAMQKMLTV